jgi:glycosyltransferase involved in cell wall biosynthesis
VPLRRSRRAETLRVLHVNKFLFRKGGAESYMLDLAELQRGAGDEVAFWGMQHRDNPRPQPLEDTFPSYVELEPSPRGATALSTAARMIWSPSSKHGLDMALRRFKPDVVHCHNIYHQLSPSILSPVRRSGTACVMTLHDYKLACPSYQMLDHGRPCDLCVTGGTWHAAKQRCKEGSLLASTLLSVESGVHRMIHAYAPVGVFISPSQFLANVMERSGVESERIKVVNHFIDLQNTPSSDGSATGFLFVGRLSPEKGVDTLIEAVARMPQDTRLDIAGDGPSRAILERLAGERAPGRVTFRGRVAAGQVRELLAGSIASVVPSRWYENQPMAILESFAARVPVVATNLGGIPELIQDEVEGLVVAPDDPAALAAAMRRLSDDPDWAHRMGTNAHLRLCEHFSPEGHLERLAEVYENARVVASSARQGW